MLGLGLFGFRAGRVSADGLVYLDKPETFD